jgi:hypothetical protein
MASREAVERDSRTATQVGNGEQVSFPTGATRSTSEDKVDFEGHINPEVQAIFGQYMHDHRVQRDGRLRASDNWQRGVPIYRYVKSLIRHTFEFWRMWRGNIVINVDNGHPFTLREVLCAIRFNVDGLIYELNRSEVTGPDSTFSHLDSQYIDSAHRTHLETL